MPIAAATWRMGFPHHVYASAAEEESDNSPAAAPTLQGPLSIVFRRSLTAASSLSTVRVIAAGGVLWLRWK
jgi:hypothetical protein